MTSEAKGGRRRKRLKEDDSDGEDADEEPELPEEEQKEKFDPITSAGWKAGERIPYAALAALFDRVDAEPGRLKMIHEVSNFLRSVIALSPEQLVTCMYLLCNKIAPAYEGKELGVGDALLIKAVAEAVGLSPQAIKERVKVEGDLGSVVGKCRSAQKTLFVEPPKLTVVGVFKTFSEIGAFAGQKSAEKKIRAIQGLLTAARGTEAKYLVRSMQGNLRIGLAEKSVLSALARAATLTPPAASSAPTKLTPKEADRRVKQAYIECPNYQKVIVALLAYGIEDLTRHCRLTPGIPVQVMLGKPVKGIAAVLERFAEALFTLEFKYDGERAQIHLLDDGSIRIYSRNSENHTLKYPDILKFLPSAFAGGGLEEQKECKVQNFIIDCEVVAWDKKNERILPFQVLSTRKKSAASDQEIDVQVCLFGFDLLYLNGKSYLDEPFSVRRAALRGAFREQKGQFHFASYCDTSNLDEIKTFLKLAIASSCEGLMVKALDVDASYVPAKRNWLKIKKDYLAGGDTLDLVPIAAFFGKGKRTGQYGSFLMALYNEDTEEYETVCKLGTGFSEEMLESLHTFLKGHEIDGPREYYRYPEGWDPDAWFECAAVWEVLCADLSISPVHMGASGLAHEHKGIGLRFPRFVRIREDKAPTQATSSTQVYEMYCNQAGVKKH